MTVDKNSCYIVKREAEMNRYTVMLNQSERQQLAVILRKGVHDAQTVINALILLNCDEGEFNKFIQADEKIVSLLRIDQEKVNRVRRRFVLGDLELALSDGQDQ